MDQFSEVCVVAKKNGRVTSSENVPVFLVEAIVIRILDIFFIKNYCTFVIFQTVVVCLALSEEVNMQTFVMISRITICRNYLYTKSFILVIAFFLIKYFHFFLIVKMNANYAEMCRLGNLEADFQQVPLFFSEMFTVLL